MPADFAPTRPVMLVELSYPFPANHIRPAKDRSHVWLSRSRNGPSAAYFSQQPWSLPPTNSLTMQSTFYADPFTDQRVATLTPLQNAESITPLFTQPPSFTPIDYVWEGEFRLIGFNVQPQPVWPGQTLTLNLYWENLTRVLWQYETVVEILDGAGQIVGRWPENYTEMFRWREDVPVRTQHFLYIGPELPLGPYLIRISLQNAVGQSVPAYVQGGDSLENQPIVGLFYVVDQDTDPRQPPIERRATLGDGIDLLGYAPPQPLSERTFRGKLYWRATKGIEKDFVSFVQLLDSKGKLVTSWESPPLNELYPTSHWKRDEVVVDEFDLLLPDKLLPDEYRLDIGMFDPESGLRLRAKDDQGKSLPNNVVTLTRFSIF